MFATYCVCECVTFISNYVVMLMLKEVSLVLYNIIEYSKSAHIPSSKSQKFMYLFCTCFRVQSFEKCE